MKKHISFYCILCITCSLFLSSCDDNENDDRDTGVIQLNEILVGDYELNLADASQNTEAPTGEPVKILLAGPVNTETAEANIEIRETSGGTVIEKTLAFDDDNHTIVISAAMSSNVQYTLSIKDGLRGANGEKFPGFQTTFTTVPGVITVTSIVVNGTDVTAQSRIKDIPLQGSAFEVTFSKALDPSTVTPETFLINGFAVIPVSVSLSNENKTVVVTPGVALSDLRRYRLQITAALKGTNDEIFTVYNRFFYTTSSPELDHPLISDEELLTLVQQRTFNYFYDFAQPTSGMARERDTSGDLVTSGGSGFGLMALIVGIERNFITRAQGVERISKIVTFLETADRFHGAWSHWINGNTGKVIPFSANDNGGDLVETSFLVQGLLTVRQYLNANDPTEATLIGRINALWEAVEWDWYTQNGQDVLYWHWSPDKNWIMNHQIRGHNETLITYVLAASSPDHSINASVYTNGYARAGAIRNGRNFYDITLPLGEDYGGPLFFTHYSFLGLNPTNLADTYAEYWTQNVNHSLINQAYVKANPKNWVGYSEDNWGLTASDNSAGYSAHSPTNDLGVITPTAALSSLPYTPEESMKALRFFYYSIGDRLWGAYGFYDAFNLTDGWTASSYLAIDQGPIVVMIENHRTGLLWDLFMSAPEIQGGLTKLGFEY